MKKAKKLKLALPKGSLQEATVSLFSRAGFEVRADSRSYNLDIDDVEIEAVLLRAQEIPRYVEIGAFDAGISGKDWIRENRARVREVCELMYAKQGFRSVKIVLAVPRGGGITSVRDLEGKIVATELVAVTRSYLRKHGVKADVEFSYGATEIKAGNLVDAIVEITETGTTLRSHGLEIIDVLMESTPRLIANREAMKDRWKRDKIENIALLLRSALVGAGKVGLKMNVEQKNLKAVLGHLPAMKRPTVAPLAGERWFAVETVINKDEAKRLIPLLKKKGAQGLVEYPLNKVID